MIELLFLVALVGLGTWVAQRFLVRVTVFDYQHAVLFENGRYVRTLEPGAYWVLTLKSKIDVVDGRLHVLTVPGQEVLSLDGVTLKLSMLIEYRVADPGKALLEHADYLESLYAVVQKELRAAIGATAIETILETKNEWASALAAAIKAHAEKLGLEISDVSIKDIMFPGTLKESFSKVARARQDAHAALEKARGETAALRSLANAAKTMSANPDLYRLRLLQSLDQAESLVVHVGAQHDADGRHETGTS